MLLTRVDLYIFYCIKEVTEKCVEIIIVCMRDKLCYVYRKTKVITWRVK